VASLNLARVAVAEKDGPRAEKFLRQTLEVEPAQPLALIGLAQFATGRRDFQAARALLDRMPESRARTRGEAEWFALQGKFDDSAQLYAQLFELEPTQELALLAYDTARRAGRPNPDAQLLRWHADHPQAKETNLALAFVALEKNDLERAQSLYEAVVAVDPNNVTAVNNLAWLYGERKDPRALQFGERALAAEPDNPAVADTVGWLYVRGGDAARGLPLLERAAKALPTQREIAFHWAVALAETGGSARAIEILEGVTGDGRDFRNRAEALTRLDDLRRRTR
jgi:Tfp pilus assembly protein PilF